MANRTIRGKGSSSTSEMPWQHKTVIFPVIKARPNQPGLFEGRDYLVGASFSVADILAGHTLLWARGARLCYRTGRARGGVP